MQTTEAAGSKGGRCGWRWGKKVTGRGNTRCFGSRSSRLATTVDYDDLQEKVDGRRDAEQRVGAVELKRGKVASPSTGGVRGGAGPTDEPRATGLNTRTYRDVRALPRTPGPDKRPSDVGTDGC